MQEDHRTDQAAAHVMHGGSVDVRGARHERIAKLREGCVDRRRLVQSFSRRVTREAVPFMRVRAGRGQAGAPSLSLSFSE